MTKPFPTEETLGPQWGLFQNTKTCASFSSLAPVELATDREKALAMTVLAETTMVKTAAAMSSSE